MNFTVTYIYIIVGSCTQEDPNSERYPSSKPRPTRVVLLGVRCAKTHTRPGTVFGKI